MASYMIDNIRIRMNKIGLNMKQLSLKAGLGETAIRDLFQGRSGSARIETGEKIAAALGCTLRDLLAPPHEHTQRNVVPLPIIGAVEAGVWKEAIEWPRSDWQYEPVPDDPRFAGYTRFGLQVRGRSMNQLYRDGDFVVCVPMIELQEKPEPGRRYVVYRIDSNGNIEATLKEYFIDPDGKAWLVPKSDDPRYQGAIELDNGETEDIQIYARVTGYWRREG